MPAFSADLPAPTTEEKDTLLNQIKVLDPGQNGILVHQLRPFYPNAGWNVIFQRLYALADEGKLKKGSKPGDKVSFETYTWL